MTQTFEEWINDMDWANPKLTEEAEGNRGAAHLAWKARDAEVAEKDRRIAELLSDITRETLENTERIKKIITLESRIEAGMVLAEKWLVEADECGDAHTECDLHRSAAELRAALGEPVRKP